MNWIIVLVYIVSSFRITKKVILNVCNEYFLSRWKDYEEAAKMTGKDKAIKLLKRREEQLRKNITV
jgi:hypothetical protein